MKLMLVTNPPGTGGSHKWEQTTPSLAGILREAGHSVDVTDTGQGAGPAGPDGLRRHLAEHVAQPEIRSRPRGELKGTVCTRSYRTAAGLVSIHVSPDSCPDWPAMQEMTAGGWVTGKSTHPPLMTFTVRVTDPDNPCAAGVEDFETWDELYIQLNVSPRANVFLYSEYEGTDWPLGWTATYGEGRVFNTALGHAAESHNAGFRRLLLNGVEWVTQ